MLKYDICGAAIITIVLLLTLSLIVLATDFIPSAQAKPPSSNGHAKTTKASKPGGFVPRTTGGGFAEEPPTQPSWLLVHI